MGQSGESRGERVRGVLQAEWDRSRSHFVVVSEWRVVDARGEIVEILGRGPVGHLEDDEWTERNILRRSRALLAETRAYTEEREDGVQRLL